MIHNLGQNPNRTGHHRALWRALCPASPSQPRRPPACHPPDPADVRTHLEDKLEEEITGYRDSGDPNELLGPVAMIQAILETDDVDRATCERGDFRQRI